MSTKIGEIIESTSTEFTAECYELNANPCTRESGKSNRTEVKRFLALSVSQVPPASNQADILLPAVKMKSRKKPSISPVHN